MEQFVLVSAFLYNYMKSLNTRTVTKQELPNDQLEQTPSYQFDSMKKEINRGLFAKADSLGDNILFYPPIKLSNSQTFILDGVKTGVLLSDFAQKLRCRNADIPDMYFTLLDAAGISPTLVMNQNAKPKERENCVPSKKSTSEAANLVHTKRSCWSVCAQFSES